MMLSPLMMPRPYLPGAEYRDVRHIKKISEELGLGVYRDPGSISEPPRGLIILGEGTPDDYVLALVAWASNGKVLSRWLRPLGGPGERWTRLDAIKALRTIREARVTLPKCRGVVLIIDRDSSSLREIRDAAASRLSEHGFKILEEQEMAGGWLRRFTCEWRPGAKLDVLVAVSGMSLSAYSKDTVEVHLLEAGRKVLGQDRIEEILRMAWDEQDEHRRADPKRAWRKLVKEEQWQVLKWLRDHPGELRRLFRQHYEALRLLHQEG